MSSAATAPRRWRKQPFIQSPVKRWSIYIGAVVYLALAVGSLEIRWQRIWEGVPRAFEFMLAFFTPDFVSRAEDIYQGFLESLAITGASTVFGLLISVPIGLGAARNISPVPVYLFCRGIIALSRAFQEIIVAILFVAMFGFGPFAGVLTLSFATIGFIAKLLAEEIEDINKEQAEAIRATGSSWLQLMNYGIQPQVAPRLVGLSMYRLDINFRESAIIGIVGAGGIGATLNTAFDRYEFNTAAAILLVIIVIVMGAEYASGYVRKFLI